MPAETEVGLRAWTDDDLPLLRGLLGDPRMTIHLGGPETEEQLLKRHAKYLAVDGTGTGRVFVITTGPQRTAAGWLGYWQSEWHGEAAWEMGWSVLPDFQGRGVASRGAAQAIQVLEGERTHRFVYAVPAVDNGPSNGVCAKLGFVMVRTESLEYPPGSDLWAECAIWRRELPTAVAG